MKDLFVRLAREGAAVLLSSHLLADVEDVCGRIGILERGKLRRVGRVDELLADRKTLLLKMKALPESSREELMSEIERITGERPSAEHPSRSLEELFLETLERKDTEDARGSGHRSDDAS